MGAGGSVTSVHAGKKDNKPNTLDGNSGQKGHQSGVRKAFSARPYLAQNYFS